MSVQEQFSSRWGIILASIGMAIGAGNLWRFPRLAGQYGGTFIVLWMVFLLVWSIPILMAEFAIGKKGRQGVIRSFTAVAGQRFWWMGFFIAFCCLGITFYYAIVTAWGLHYWLFSVQNALAPFLGEPTLSDRLADRPSYLQEHWVSISSGSLQTLTLTVLGIAVGYLILYRGVRGGLEIANRFIMPVLLGLLLLIVGISVSIGNGLTGLEYMYTIRTELFAEPKVWIEALSQSAWSTGAGWGLVMTIASYSREKEDVTLNNFISGFGNNTASLLSGMAILPAVFALAPAKEEAIAYLQQGNQQLTFNVIPQLFAQIPGGSLLSIAFFTAFILAAFSSLLTMFELLIRLIADLEISRKRATIIGAILSILFGTPSALSLDFFSNQDWVWGLGLIISGMFVAFAAVKGNVLRFKKDLIDQDSDFRMPDWLFATCLFLCFPLGLLLLWWWMSQGYDANPWFTPEGHWNVFSVYSNATIITQWAVLLIVGIVLTFALRKK